MELAYQSYVISDDKNRIDTRTVADFLLTTYWGNKRTTEQIALSIRNSICYGVYDGDVMIGFARLITDGATMYYLCDVFVLDAYRGQGIAKKLVEAITEAPEYQGLTGLLGTLDAHGLYEQYGFRREPDRYMKRFPQAAWTVNQP